MTFVLSPEQTQLQDTVRSFLDEKSPEPEVRRLMAGDIGYDPVVWKRMGDELGLLGLAIPEEFGGQGYSHVELTIVLEEMGRSLLCAPFFSTAVLAATALLQSGDTPAQQRYLPRLAAGELIATLAVVEDSGVWDPHAIATSAIETDGGWSLTGQKSFVLDGHIADLLLVAARTQKGLGLFAVSGDAAGLHREPLSTLDQTRKQARLTLDAVPATPVGDGVQAWAVVDQVLDRAASCLAAEQVGGAQRVLDLSAQYAKNRVQFGRPIGSFQAIKHKAANMLVAVESARSAAYHAGLASATDAEDLPVAAAVAKAYCSTTYMQAAKDAIQIHGGIGFTWEHSAHLYFKRAKSSELLLGSPAHWRARLADQLDI